MGSDDSRYAAVRDRTRRLFMQSAGLVGLGLAGGTAAASRRDDEEDTSSSESTGAEEGTDGRTPIDSPTVIDEPGEYELVADLAPDRLDQPGCIVVDLEDESGDVHLHGNGHLIDLRETEYEEGTHLQTNPTGIGITNNPWGFRRNRDVRWETTIEDVEVRGGRSGVDSRGGTDTSPDRLRLVGVTLVENERGVTLYVDGGTLEDCVVEDNTTGVQLQTWGVRNDGGEYTWVGAETDLRNCTVRANSSAGVLLHSEDVVTVESSRVVSNGIGIEAAELEWGADWPQTRITVTGSHICRNEGYGVLAASRREADRTDVVDAVDNYWGAADGPSSLRHETHFEDGRWERRYETPESPFADPETGRLADGDGDAISESEDPGVSNVRFDPYHESSLEDVGADR